MILSRYLTALPEASGGQLDIFPYKPLKEGGKCLLFFVCFFLISGKQDSSALLYFGIINYKTSKRIFTTHFKKKNKTHFVEKSCNNRY